ncbi:hypothetical protein D6C90_02932 [Aureobasidium pullulans]|uniref:Uncharacterized protein n=1 Tax=Aureobasidium pullulans TaxID=5580 RepID=A0A4S9VFC0_AURPU|nr:hypothetical protein D6C90_02932 [Aureobasidium pullulans]
MASLFKATTTTVPLHKLLNAADKDERDKLTGQWRDHKLQELNFVGVVGGLVAGMLSGTGSWPVIQPNGKISPWTVRACWYCGILFAVAAVLTALQQSIRLHRLSCHQHPGKYIRRLISQQHPDRNGLILARKSHVMLWQCGTYFLSLSALSMLVGMFILIWDATDPIAGGFKRAWWTGEAKLAVTFSIIGLFIACVFVFQQFALYTWRGEDDSAVHARQQDEP